MKPEPKPRQGNYWGMQIVNQHFSLGTWIEGEEFCYPSGKFLRRAYAVCADGKRRVFRAGVADTFFSIPARGRINYKYVSGFLSVDHSGLLIFTEVKSGKDTLPAGCDTAPGGDQDA